MGEELNRLTVVPPEGVEWANRWVELENAYFELEKQRSSLQQEVDALRQSLRDGPQEHAAPAAPGEELEELRTQLQEARMEADLRLTEEVRKDEKISRLAAELEKQTLRLSEMSQQKFDIERQKYEKESEMLPISIAKERLEQERQSQDRLIEQLRKEQEKLFNDKYEMARNLRRDLEGAQQEVKYHKSIAEDAREAQYRERKLKEELQLQLKEERAEFATKQEMLEEDCRIKQDQLDRTSRHWQTCREQLDEAVRGLQQMAEVEQQKTALQVELEELRKELQSCKEEHEDFLRKRLPGADTGELPRGFESVTELFRIATTSKEEAMKERAARENLQQVLADIEREIRQRYPVLMSQVHELREMRSQNAELKEQNKIIYKKAQEYAIYNRDAEARAQRAEHSNRIIEAHAQDLTKQLTVMLYEKTRRQTINLSGTSRTWFALNQAEEENEWPIASVREVVEQNVALRKAVRQLEDRCSKEDAEEMERLQAREEEFDEELELKTEEFKKMQAQLHDVKTALEEAAQDRDAALRKVKTLEAGGSSGPSAGSAPAAGQGGAPSSVAATPEAVSEREALRLKWEREELSERCERQAAQVQALETKGAQVAKDLAISEAHLQFERQRRRDSEDQAKRVETELRELKERFSQSGARILQLEFIEGENQRLQAESRALKDKLNEIEANKLIAPLQGELLERTKQRSQELETDRDFHKSKAEEWKSLYDACKFKQEDLEQWSALKTELETKISQLEESVKQKEAEAQAQQAETEVALNDARGKNETLSKACEELEKETKEKDRQVQEAGVLQSELNKKVAQLEGRLEEERNKMQALTKAKEEMDKEAKEVEKRVKAIEALKQLQVKRIETLTAEKGKLGDENAKLKAETAKSTAAEGEKASKLTEEISKLKAEKSKLSEEHAKLKAEAAKSTAAEGEKASKLTEEISKLKAEKTKLGEAMAKLKAEAAKGTAEEVKTVQKQADLAIHLSMEYRKALEALLPEVEKTAPEKSQQEIKSQPPKPKEEVAEPQTATAAAAGGTKRKVENPGPMRLEQLKEANVHLMVEERAPKAVRSEGQPNPPAVKKAPVPPKAAPQVQTGAATPAGGGSGPSGKAEGAASASPSLPPQTAPIQVVVDDDDAAEAPPDAK